jgi:predicted GNAT superfamily acetyltransferase
MLIFPKFTTLDFGNVYKTQLEKLVKKSKLLKDAKPQAQVGGMFGSLVQGTAESEKSRMLAFVNENFSVLQNVGHVEVDVVSETERKVMRSQNSPRLLQALVTLPNDIKSFERLQLKFSKETGQAQTRVKIRKKFAGSKLVFELLVEHGLSVGIPETQKDNLYKARLERAFTIGSGLTAQIRKDISILADLETSKTIKQHIEQNLASLLKSGKRVQDYSSLTDIVQTTNVTKTKVTTKLKS